MSTTETLVRDALSATADIREVDVEDLWQRFLAGQTQRSPRRSHWLVPLAAAAVTLLIVGVVVAVRGQFAATQVAIPANSYDLKQLPPWPNGMAATAYPLPAPASTPLVFDAPYYRTVVYYTGRPSRLCVIEILHAVGAPAHTMSIVCAGSEHPANPIAQGPGWMLGTAPAATRHIVFRVDGRRFGVQFVKAAHMPRGVFFARYPSGNPRTTITWTFTNGDGRVIHDPGAGASPRVVTPPPPYDPNSARATPVSAIATFNESSGRVLHIYWAGDKHGFCSNEQVAVTGRRPATVSEDCGASFSSAGIYGPGQWLPADAGGGGESHAAIDLWGIMPPGATKTVIVGTAGRTPMQTAQADGMPTGVYAGSVDSGGGAMVIYFLDPDGHVVAAQPWQFPSAPPSWFRFRVTNRPGEQGPLRNH